MHEAGLAASVVEAVAREGLNGKPLRIFVSGGHGDPDAFDAALVAHIVADARWTDAPIAVEHTPQARVCSACSETFAGASDSADCPRCGGAALPAPGFEQIAIEVDTASSSERA